MPGDNRSSDVFQYVVSLRSIASGGGEVLESIILSGLGNCTGGCVSTVSGAAVRPATSYTSVSIAAQNSFSQSLYSTSIAVSTLSSAPGGVGAPSVSVVGPTFLGLNWTAAASNGDDVTAYRVYLCDVPYADMLAEQCSLSLVTGSPPATSLLAGGLPPAHNFTVSVQAVNGLGVSPNVSMPGIYTTLDVPRQCDSPTRRTPALEGLPLQTTLHIVWNAPYNNGRPLLSYNLTVTNQLTSNTEYVVVPHVEGVASYEYTKTGLFPGTWHGFSVSASNELGPGLFSEHVMLRTQTDVPGTPPVPYVILESGSTIIVGVHESAYNGGFDITNYELQINGQTVALQGNPLTLNYTISPRNPYQTYQIRSRARNQPGEFSAYSDYQIINAISTLYPNSPTDLEVPSASVGARSFLLRWTMPNDALSDNILRYVLSMSSVGTQLAQLERTDCVSGCSYAIDASVLSLNAATSYALTLRAVNSLGQSAPAALVGNVTTLAAVPDPAGVPQVSGVDGSSFDVQWTAPEDNGAAVTSYEVTAYNVQSGGRVQQVTSSTSASFNGLDAGQNWTVTVLALNSIGYSANASAPGEYTTHSIPQKCYEPFAADLRGLIRTTAIFIAWHAPFDNGRPIIDYELTVDGVPNAYRYAPGEPEQFLHMELIPGTQHSYSLRARNSVGYSAPSSTLTLQTQDGVPAIPVPPVPDYSTVNGERFINLQLTQSAYSGVFGQSVPLRYEIEQRQSASSSGWALTYYNVSTDVMLEEIPRLNTQNYQFRVRAVNSVGKSDWSGIVVVPNDFSGVPTEPSNVTIFRPTITATSLVVQWQLPAIGKNANASFQIRLIPNTTTATGRRLLQEVPLQEVPLQEVPLQEVPLQLGASREGVRITDGRQLQSLGEGTLQAFANFGACTVSGAFYMCEWTVTGVSPSTSYEVEILAENAIGTSLPSDRAEVTTPAGGPGAPVSFAVRSATHESLTFSWYVPPHYGSPLRGYLLHLNDGTDEGSSLVGIDANAVELDLEPGDNCEQLVAATAAAGPAEGSRLSFIATGLLGGRSFNVSILACNEVGSSPYGACACAPPLCDPGCATDRPAHTYAPPDAPDGPSQNADPVLDQEKSRQLFVTWSRPFSHYLPVLETELIINDVPFPLLTSAGQDAPAELNLTDTDGPITPATQYSAKVRMRNAEGWGNWSVQTWLSTIPDVPDAPPQPRCDANQSTDNMMYVRLQPALDNGQRVLEYEVNVSTFAGDVLLVMGGVPASVAGAGGLQVKNGSAFNYSGSSFAPETAYRVSARARNELGWSSHSMVAASCSTTAVPWLQIRWEIIAAAVSAALLLFICFIIICRCTELPKILAPRLRRRVEKEDPLDDFIVKEDTPLEDFDPEMRLNPVILAKLEVERLKAARRRGKKPGKGGGPVWRGGPGALARLNFKMEKEGEKEKEPKKANMKTIDVMLQRANKAQPQTAGAAREITRRVMTMNSQAKEKKRHAFAADRMIAEAKTAQCAANSAACARAAAKMQMSALPEEDDE
jgi:hypothetical protein